jgi:hypothetical protein
MEVGWWALWNFPCVTPRPLWKSFWLAPAKAK